MQTQRGRLLRQLGHARMDLDVVVQKKASGRSTVSNGGKRAPSSSAPDVPSKPSSRRRARAGLPKRE